MTRSKAVSVASVTRILTFVSIELDTTQVFNVGDHELRSYATDEPKVVQTVGIDDSPAR